MMRAAVCLLVAFSGRLQAQENCGFPVSLARSGFEDGEQPAFVTLPLDSAPLAVTITSPAEGEVIPSDRLQIYGTLAGPANVGVMVDSQLALANATQFTTRPIQLDPGAQTISVVVKTMDGASVTASRNITVTPSIGQDVRLEASSTGGYAPQAIRFNLRTRFPALQTQVTRMQVDYQGDGSFEVDQANANASLSFNYDAIGVYSPLARVTFDDGDSMTPPVVREGRYRIQMQSFAYARQTLCKVYYTMKSRLQANQSTLALNTLGTRIRPKFQTLWTSLGASLPTVAANLGQIATGQISDVSAELMMAIPDPVNPGAFLGYPVLFTRGSDGIWRIYGM
jgi:hypothetical protein